jgi:hypothetical protein
MAFITAPDLPGLYVEDLADAAEFAKLQMLSVPGSIFIVNVVRDRAYLVSEQYYVCRQ